MNDFMKETVDIVKAQASVRVLNEEELLSMIKKIATGLKNVMREAENIASSDSLLALQTDAKKSIKEKSIICLECGKSFRLIAKKHLASHGLTPETYRDKWGLRKDISLTCRELQRKRRNILKDMRLWEKHAAAAAARK